MPTIRSAAASAAALVLVAGSLAAQTAAPTPAPADSAPNWFTTASSTILKMPDKTIEIIGLNRWTPAMIQDSMNVHSPGDSLTSHACAAVLRYDLKFAEAASFGTRAPDDSTREYVVVPIIEPQDSGLIVHRKSTLDTAGSKASWTPLIVLLKKYKEDQVFEAVQARITARAKHEAPVMPKAITADSDRVIVREVWAYLDQHSKKADLAEARRYLAGAPNLWDRTAAVAIMSSFSADDANWWTLTATVHEQEGSPRMFAGEVLRGWARAKPRPVNWKPASADLHAILNGANLWVLDQMLFALLKTGVTPELAAPLLKDGGHAVVMFAGASHPRFRDPAQNFLKAVSGKDFGGDVKQWQAWIATL